MNAFCLNWNGIFIGGNEKKMLCWVIGSVWMMNILIFGSFFFLLALSVFIVTTRGNVGHFWGSSFPGLQPVLSASAIVGMWKHVFI